MPAKPKRKGPPKDTAADLASAILAIIYECVPPDSLPDDKRARHQASLGDALKAFRRSR